MHSLNKVLVTKFDFYHSVGFQDATSTSIIGEHLHETRIYRRINDRPSTAPEFSIRWNINEYRFAILSQPVHDVRAELDDLLIHVCKRE